MTTRQQDSEGAGHVRYTYRLRVSSTARAGLMAEWARCRWVWNECVAVSRKVHAANRDAAEKATCGPAQLDKMLTEARSAMAWLREGASVPQQQTIRDFAKSRAKAMKDITAKLPVRQRAGMPCIKRKRDALPTLNYTQRGFRLKDGRLHVAGGIVLTVVWSRDLPAVTSSVRVYQDSLGHWYASFVVVAETQPLPATGRVLGVDWGVKETATTTSDAHDLPHAEHGKRAAQRLAAYQRMMARRKPARGQAASKGYREARRQAAKLHKKVARQRQDTARKWACTFALIAAFGAVLGGSTVAHAADSPAPRSDLSARTYYWDRFDKEWYLNGGYPCELDTAHDYRNPSWPIDLINTTHCHRRVWLYANLDKTGEKKCIPPGSARKITDDDLKMAMILRIGAKGGCP